MHKKQKNELDKILAGLFIFIGLFIWYKFFSNNWVLFFVVVIVGSILPTLIINMLPTTSSRKSSPKKTTKSKQLVKTTSNSDTNINSSNRLSSNDEILNLSLEKMSWREFERLCYLYYKAKGYKPEETKNGADGGIDLIYYHPYHKGKVAVQIKHRINSGNQVNVKEIRELNTSKRKYDCILSEFITTSTYTNDALKEAGDFKIVTHDIDWVKNKIVKWQNEEAKRKNLLVLNK